MPDAVGDGVKKVLRLFQLGRIGQLPAALAFGDWRGARDQNSAAVFNVISDTVLQLLVK